MKSIKSKILYFFSTLFMLLILSTSSKILGYSSENFESQYGVTTSNVNFRKSANLDASSVLFTLQSNSKVRVVGSIDNFYIVQLEDGKVGLVSKDYVNITENTGTFPEYTNLEKYFATANSNSINIRGGPGTNFSIYGKLNLNEKVEVIGKTNNFFLIVTENNTVGMVRDDLISKEFNIPESEITQKRTELLNLINNERKNNGLIALEVLPRLEEVATIKAQDMVKNNYFDHTSPTYGNPFDMMKNFGITYKTAGENIAGNSTIEGAFNSWITSDTHKQNILSTAYNYVGIGIEPSERYGYVVVVMFIGK